MRTALRLAQRGEGRTAPNPSVGAVVYRASGVLGRGTTQPPAGSHAEVVALDRARKRGGAVRLRGASMAVTLEPCAHTGRTGPCVEAIIAAGLRHVSVGCRDPHARVAGRGIRRLRAAGIEVDVGRLGDACREQHRAFLSVCERGRPWLTLKLAGSLDGRIATASGESRWISGEASRRVVHQLRAHVDAIMVGSGTALADDPELSVRDRGRVVHRPRRILIDSRLRVPVRARLYQQESERTWVACGRGVRGIRSREATGAQVIESRRMRGGRLDLPALLQALATRGLTSVLVEGGGGLAAALLRADLVDEIHWFVAPMLIGGDGVPALGPLGVSQLARAPRFGDSGALANFANFSDWVVRRRGEDLHVHLRAGSPGRASPSSRRKAARGSLR